MQSVGPPTGDDIESETVCDEDTQGDAASTPSGKSISDDIQQQSMLDLSKAVDVTAGPDEISAETIDAPRECLKGVQGEKHSFPADGKSKHSCKSAKAEGDIEARVATAGASFAASSVLNATATLSIPVAAVPQTISRPSMTRTVHPETKPSSKQPSVVAIASNVELEPTQLQGGNMKTEAESGSVNRMLSPDRGSVADVDGEANASPVSVRSIPFHTQINPATSVVLPAATFQPLLLRNDRHPEIGILAEEDRASVVAEPAMQPVVAEPIKRLEFQWNDSSLGRISLTAEMRDGALHAVLSSHTASSLNATELHQFLEDSRVSVHGLQVNGVSALPDALRNAAGGASAVDAGTAMSGSELSRRGQGRGGSSEDERRPSHPKAERNETTSRRSEIRSAVVSQQRDQRLSIHI